MQKHGRKDFVMLDDDECDQDLEEPTKEMLRHFAQFHGYQELALTLC